MMKSLKLLPIVMVTVEHLPMHCNIYETSSHKDRQTDRQTHKQILPSVVNTLYVLIRLQASMNFSGISSSGKL